MEHKRQSHDPRRRDPQASHHSPRGSQPQQVVLLGSNSSKESPAISSPSFSVGSTPRGPVSDKKRVLQEISVAEKEMPRDLVQQRNFERGLAIRDRFLFSFNSIPFLRTFLLTSLFSCERLLEGYMELLFLDYDYAVEKDVEARVWKTLFHAFIEEYRRRLREPVSTLLHSTTV